MERIITKDELIELFTAWNSIELFSERCEAMIGYYDSLNVSVISEIFIHNKYNDFRCYGVDFMHDGTQIELY